jgi:hypothetical protein
MSSLQRRFEILLPQRFNDGTAVPDELVGQTILEFKEQLKARFQQIDIRITTYLIEVY